MSGTRQPRELLLTRRELQALAWASQGLSRTETADRMGISPETVKMHLRTGGAKLDSLNTTHAVWIARHRIEQEMEDITKSVY